MAGTKVQQVLVTRFSQQRGSTGVTASVVSLGANLGKLDTLDQDWTLVVIQVLDTLDQDWTLAVIVMVIWHPGISLDIYQDWTRIVVENLGTSLGYDVQVWTPRFQDWSYLGTSPGHLVQDWTLMFQKWQYLGNSLGHGVQDWTLMFQNWQYLGSSLGHLVQDWTRMFQVQKDTEPATRLQV